MFSIAKLLFIACIMHLTLSPRIVSSLTVTIHLYDMPDCRESSLVEDLSYDMGTCDPTTGVCDQQCYGWSRETFMGSDGQNSAKDFRCYNNWGITYTQWVGNDDCDGIILNEKETMLGCCIEEPSGELWATMFVEDHDIIANCADPPAHLEPNTCFDPSELVTDDDDDTNTGDGVGTSGASDDGVSTEELNDANTISLSHTIMALVCVIVVLQLF